MSEFEYSTFQLTPAMIEVLRQGSPISLKIRPTNHGLWREGEIDVLILPGSDEAREALRIADLPCFSKRGVYINPRSVPMAFRSAVQSGLKRSA